MIKSIFSVSENNIFAFSKLGHLANLQPYIEPSAGMVFSRNIFAHMRPADGAVLDVSVCDYTALDLAHSSSLMDDPAAQAVYNFTNATVPALSTPVVLEWDYNLYWDAAHNATPLGPGGAWDAHSIAADPLFVGDATPPWARGALDFALAPGSPALAIPGFRRIEVERIGLGPAFAFSLAAFARRAAQRDKVQAETYDRQVGLWREGSYGISGGAGRWPFAPGAWALYRRVDVADATVLRLRLAPGSAALTVALALGDPSGVLATFAVPAGAAAGAMATFEVPLAAPLTVAGGDVFLLPSETCVIDWFQFV